jgi:periplasmic protein TonB
MKYCYMLIAFLTLSVCNAQDEQPANFASLQVKPEYPGGIREFYMFVNQNFRVPDVPTSQVLRVTVSFVVERDGSLSGVRCLKDPGYGMGDEAVRVVKACPEKWSPGIQNGKPVRAQYILPIVITITADTTPADSIAPQKP